MKRVLIALDFDPSAERVADTGYKLATSMNAEIILLHVIADAAYYSSTTYSPIMGFTGFEDNIIDTTVLPLQLEKESERFLEQTKKHLGEDSIKILVLDGDFVEVILNTAQEHQADIIVMGTHSRRGLDKLLMGNLAEKVLNRSTIPLLIIPNIEDKK